MAGWRTAGCSPRSATRAEHSGRYTVKIYAAAKLKWEARLLAFEESERTGRGWS